MSSFAEIAVNIPQVSGVYTYHLPSELEDKIVVGQLVLVPFGPRTVQGVVLDFIEQTLLTETRDVIELVDEDVAVTTAQIALARQMAEDWVAPLAACVGLMLPPGVDQQADLLYHVRGVLPEGVSQTQKRLYQLLQKHGSLRGQQIDRRMPRVNWREAARPLIRRGALRTEPVTPKPKVRPKMIRTARPGCSTEVAQAALPHLGRAGSEALKRRQALLQRLMVDQETVEVAWLYAETGANSSDLRFLEKKGLLILGESETLRDPLAQVDFRLYEAPQLTAAQDQVWEKIEASIRQSGDGETVRPILLHGVTGSGKTEIYLRAVKAVLEQGRQAIVLVPEIALTPQTIQRFAGRFPGRVGLVHSRLSSGERYDTWRRARSGLLDLVVGPRSALFTPFSRLGLIVVDECHDDSYYQSESIPYFNARETAATYARLAGAVCLMGSATPDLTSVYKGEQGIYQSLRLPVRILAHHAAVQAQIERLGHLSEYRDRVSQSHYRTLEGLAETIDLPPVSVVDMREELKAGNRSIFSRQLQSALGQVLERGEQAILFLNRRGTATYVFCRDCGMVMRCPRCEVPLTYHENDGALVCHYCGYHRRMPQTCPVCKSTRIRQYGTGTQKVEKDLQETFPCVRTLRWDFETTRQKGAHESILRQFSQHQVDVLIGTQMLAKGMDLPLVTLVGVVLADVGLNMPDYRAGERSFQVLTQVAGRAGRSLLGGEVVLQTFQPEHYVIQAAAKHDFWAFYQMEMGFREQANYPPFAQLVRLEYRHFNPLQAENAAHGMAARVNSWLKEEERTNTRLIGPAPCFFARVGGMYRWQIVICGPSPVSLLRGRQLGDWRLEVNPPSLL